MSDEWYTPGPVMEIVNSYVADTYNVSREAFIRPFKPGGDYQAEGYEGRVVVDNPPFSILASIVDWYLERNIDFFLFSPALTALSIKNRGLAFICSAEGIVFENGRDLHITFITNLEPECVRYEPRIERGLCEVKGKDYLAKSLYRRHATNRPPGFYTSADFSSMAKGPEPWRYEIDHYADAADKHLYGGGAYVKSI